MNCAREGKYRYIQIYSNCGHGEGSSTKGTYSSNVVRGHKQSCHKRYRSTMLHTKEIRQSYGHIKHTPRAAIAGVCVRGGVGRGCFCFGLAYCWLRLNININFAQLGLSKLNASLVICLDCQINCQATFGHVYVGQRGVDGNGRGRANGSQVKWQAETVAPAPGPLSCRRNCAPKRATTPSNKTSWRCLSAASICQLSRTPVGSSSPFGIAPKLLHPAPPPNSNASPTPHIVVVIILWSFPFCGQLQLGFNLYFFVVVRSYFIVRPAMPQQQQQQQYLTTTIRLRRLPSFLAATPSPPGGLPLEFTLTTSAILSLSLETKFNFCLEAPSRTRSACVCVCMAALLVRMSVWVCVEMQTEFIHSNC